MEVAPQELAALLKLAGVGSSPEPEPEMMAKPQVSAIAIPSDDEAPTGGCGGGSDMRSLIDALDQEEEVDGRNNNRRRAQRSNRGMGT